MADKDIVICWGMAGVPESLAKRFQRPTAVITLAVPPKRSYQAQLESFGWPHPLRGIITRRAPGVTPRRIALLGFSESCTSVGAVLASKDAGLIDTAIVIDGWQSRWTNNNTPNADHSNVDPLSIVSRVGFASLAVWGPPPGSTLPSGVRTLVITHSHIPDDAYASTTRTAAVIAYRLFGSNWPTGPIPAGVVGVNEVPPFVNGPGQITDPDGRTHSFPRTVYAQSPDRYQVASGGLAILGYEDLDPTGIGDHRYQAQRVLPRVFEHYVVDRWNALDPAQGVVGLADGPQGPENWPQAEQTIVPREYWLKDPMQDPPDLSIDASKFFPELAKGGQATVQTPPGGAGGEPPLPTGPSALAVAGVAAASLAGGAAVAAGVAAAIKARRAARGK